MKRRRILLLVLVLFVAGAGTALANSVYDHYRAKKLNVNLNGSPVFTNALLVQMDRKSVPMGGLQGLLNAFGGYMKVNEEDGRVDIYKPNAQLVLMWSDAKAKDRGYTLSHTVKKDRGLFMRLTAIVDSVHENIDAVQFRILDPDGNEVIKIEDDQDEVRRSLSRDNITNVSMDFFYTFEKEGLYTVHFSVKPGGSDQFYRIGQALLESVD